MQQDKETFGADPASPLLTPMTPVGTDGVALLMRTVTGQGLSIELSIEGDKPETPKMVNPQDPAHVLAWYVQQHALSILPHAAMALAMFAKEEKDKRGGHESGRRDLDLAANESDSEGGEPA